MKVKLFPQIFIAGCVCEHSLARCRGKNDIINLPLYRERERVEAGSVIGRTVGLIWRAEKWAPNRLLESLDFVRIGVGVEIGTVFSGGVIKWLCSSLVG